MAERYGPHRYRGGGYSASQQRRPSDVSSENRYGYNSRHSDSKFRENRNRDYVGGRWNGSGDRRCSREDRRSHDVGGRWNDSDDRINSREDRKKRSYDVGGRWNGIDHRRENHEDRRSYDDKEYHEDRLRSRERFRRDDRRAFDKGFREERFGPYDRHPFVERDDRNDRHCSGERRTYRHSMSKNDSRQDKRDSNGRYEGNHSQDQNFKVYNSEGRAGVALEYNPAVIDFKFLSELQKEEPLAILTTLSNQETNLRNRLFQCFRRPFVARLLLSALTKAFTCTAAQQKLHEVFKILKESNFIDKSMAFVLDMRHEERIDEQATFRQSIMDILTILKEMDSVEECKLSDSQRKGVYAVLKVEIEYLKENTEDVINDDVLNAFKEFTAKTDGLTKGVKRGHNDSNLEEGSNVNEPANKLRGIRTVSSTEAKQSLFSDLSDKDENNEQGTGLTDQTELECNYILQCGHKCQTNCNMEHTNFCEFDVEKTFSCGHKGIIKCYKEDSALCPKPCGAVLSCEHRCPGTCEECFQGRLHRPCENKCKRILVCGHECTDKCNECPPCTRKCENRCQHSKCIKKCGELCVPCKEICTWNCEHFHCGKLCSEPCDRPRCDRRCEKKLPCNHQCIGLCGEPCPKDCRICDKKKVTELLFGNEDEPDAKFVLLEDCTANCIIESGAMDYYMDQKDEQGQIKLKECPKCKTPIRKSNRYRKLINETLQDIESVKERLLIEEHRRNKLQAEINDSLRTLPHIPFAQQMRGRLQSLKAIMSENTFVTIQNQLSLLKGILKLEEEWKERIKQEDLKGDLKTSLNFLQNFQNWVMLERSIMTQEDINDAKLERSRSTALLKILLHKQKAKCTGKVINCSLKAKMTETEGLLKGSKKYEEEIRRTVETCLKELNEKIPLSGLDISEEERVMVIEAMGLEKGHWYKCPKGHVYAITECGGATQVSRCPECKCEIGGTGHRLREDNKVATEMDGAQYGAWSEQANMENYDPFDIQF